MENSGYGNAALCPRLPLCSHVLQESLRRFCEDPRWIYSVFWRILPRNFPPPKILVWEDGFCDFRRTSNSSGSSITSIQPDLFFKMSHEVYNYGEGLMGKVSSDNGHKWVYRDPSKSDNTPSWQTSIDPQPRTWEGQFKSGIQTIVVISVCEGLLQLGSTDKIQEDHDFVTLLQTKFNHLLMTLPSVSLMTIAGGGVARGIIDPHKSIPPNAYIKPAPAPPPREQYNTTRAQLAWNMDRMNDGDYDPKQISWQADQAATSAMEDLMIDGSSDWALPARIVPSMSSLEALLSKLPSVTNDKIDDQLQQLIHIDSDMKLSAHYNTSAGGAAAAAPIDGADYYWLPKAPMPGLVASVPPQPPAYLGNASFTMSDSCSGYSCILGADPMD